MHDSSRVEPRLLVVAHGTASPVGLATTARLVRTLASARPDTDVELCFLDVAEPSLAATLATPAATAADTVLVPILLSTGYHVQVDIPAAVADRPDITVARHLGPHPLLVDALVDRLPAAVDDVTTVLLGAGSSRSAGRAELDAVGALLAQRLGSAVDVLTMADDLGAELRRRVGGRVGTVRVATYLLAEGRFVTTLRDAAAGVAQVAPPIGVHPALVELVWSRYDDALAARGDSGSPREQVR